VNCSRCLVFASISARAQCSDITTRAVQRCRSWRLSQIEVAGPRSSHDPPFGGDRCMVFGMGRQSRSRFSDPNRAQPDDSGCRYGTRPGTGASTACRPVGERSRRYLRLWVSVLFDAMSLFLRYRTLVGSSALISLP